MLTSLWRLGSAICVLVVAALIVLGVMAWRDGTIDARKLESIRRVLRGEPVFAPPPAESELARKIADLEEQQSRWSVQTRQRENDLQSLAASVEAGLTVLRQGEADLSKKAEALAEEQKRWDEARLPQALSEEQAKLQEVFKSIRDMAPQDAVKVLVRNDNKKLVQLLRLFKAEAAELWPVLMEDPEMKKVEGNRTRFDLVWEEFNKPEPKPLKTTP
jgi:hypothetical protein